MSLGDFIRTARCAHIMLYATTLDHRSFPRVIVPRNRLIRFRDWEEISARAEVRVFLLVVCGIRWIPNFFWVMIPARRQFDPLAFLFNLLLYFLIVCHRPSLLSWERERAREGGITAEIRLEQAGVCSWSGYSFSSSRFFSGDSGILDLVS